MVKVNEPSSRIVIAMDSFKGCASAAEACRWVSQGIKVALTPKFRVEEIPVCDGGTGFCEVLTTAKNGEFVEKLSGFDACMQSLSDCRCGIFNDDAGARVAVVESANTIGLARLSNQAPGIMERTSFGLGKFLLQVADLGVDKILLGLGDSAIQDCGLGLLEGLGAELLGAKKRVLSNVRTADIRKVQSINFSRPAGFPKIELACNLSSVLEGSSDTVGKYARQKGADENQVAELRRATKHLARVYEESFNRQVARVPGSGGSGGIGSALIVALDAEPRYSFRVVDEVLGISERLKGAGVVVVGEGKMDRGTARGKAPGAVSMMAAACGVPAVAVAGSIERNCFGRLTGVGIVSVQTLSNPEQDRESYMNRQNARELLREAGLRIGPLVRELCHS